MNNALSQPFESALDWNRRHPPGTRVSVRLSDGREVSTQTASWAQQWGSFAVLSLARSITLPPLLAACRRAVILREL